MGHMDSKGNDPFYILNTLHNGLNNYELVNYVPQQNKRIARNPLMSNEISPIDQSWI